MEKIVLANFKAGLAPDQITGWMEAFESRYSPQPSVRVVLAVPFLVMQEMGQRIAGLKSVSLAAQTVSPRPPGNYTGATPAAWLKQLADYTLVGHRERRVYFHEDAQSVAAQVREAVAAGIAPIICLDRDNSVSQLAAIDTDDLEQSWLAYTPDDSVQLEVPAGTGEITDMAVSLAKSGGKGVLYGGGVKPENASELISLSGVDGIMVGRSCLDGSEFAGLVNSVG
jgi:triosephosphate isomerase